MILRIVIAIFLMWILLHRRKPQHVPSHLPISERREKFRLLKVGNSREEVVEIVRHATESESNSKEEWWVYPNEEGARWNDILIFRDGILIHIGML